MCGLVDWSRGLGGSTTKLSFLRDAVSETMSLLQSFVLAVAVMTLGGCGKRGADDTAPASLEKLESRAKRGDAQAQYDLGLSC